MLIRTTALSVLLATTVLTAQAQAQAVPPSALPAQVEPGRVGQRFNLDERPALDSKPMATPPQQDTGPVDNTGPSFTLTRVNVQGNTAISSGKLSLIYKDMIGKTTTLGGVRKIASDITAYYRNQGYILTRAVVPPQRVEGGAVTIQIIEGFIDSVTFNGAEAQNQYLLKSYAEKIKLSRPLNNKDLERYLLLMDDLNGATARAVLSPSSSQPGASALTITVEHDPIEGEITADNRGSRFLGPIQTGARFATNSLFGGSEKLQLRAIGASEWDELRYYEGSYQQPYGAEGASLRFLTSYTETEPGNFLERFDIEGKSLNFSLSSKHPIIRSRQENLYGEYGFRYRDSTTDVLSSNLYDDHIRAVFLSTGYDVLDPLMAVNRIDMELSQGVDIFDGNEHFDTKSRANADPKFTKLEGQYTRLQPLNEQISFFWGVAGQYAFSPLYSSEEFGVGSIPYGSAYDPAEITGDSGVATRIEARLSNFLPETFINLYQLYAFYDYGKVWNRGVLIGENEDDSLASTGVGVRFNLIRNISGTFEIAVPMTRDVAAEGSGGDDVRGFFSLAWGF
ncbi:MAG: ShlB/FhaC/HecB family hemolysin secretion/activation protein [Rickettsiales bacterium]